MAISSAQTREAPSLAAELLALVTDPAGTYPHLLGRGHSLEVLLFPAVSGVYVGYVAAERLHVGDRLPFATAAIGVVVIGAALGLLALAFISSVLAWSSTRAGGTADLEEVTGVFGYATWPFLPLLAVVVPLEMISYGTDVFSGTRLDPGWPVSLVVTLLELGTILLWLYLVLRGEAVSAHMTNAQAAKTMGLTVMRMAAIAILLLIVLLVSFLI